MKFYFVYLMTNKYNKVIYCGVTNNILRRVLQHRNHLNEKSFTMKYRVSKLIYYETFQDIRAAISREKQIKAGKRVDKINLINVANPYWRDLFEEKTYEIATSLRSSQ